MAGYPNIFLSSLKNGLKSYWSLDNTVSDEYNVRNGSNANVTYAADNNRTYASYNGSTSYTLLSDGFYDDYFSVSAWVYLSQRKQQYFIGNSRGLNNVRGGWSFGTDGNGKLHYLFANSGGFLNVNVTGSTVLPLNQWLHVGMSVNPSTAVNFYLNGALDNSYSNLPGYATPPTPNKAVIGARWNGAGDPAGNDNFLNGSLDEIGYWNRQLDSAEIQTLYTFNKNLSPIGASAVTAYASVSASGMTNFTNLGTATTGTNTSIVSANLTTQIRLVSSVAATSATTASLTTRRFISGSVSGTATVSATLSTPLPWRTNITSYWELEGNANDYYNNLNGTATNVTYTSGKLGSAGVFNGTSSKINLGTANSLALTTFTAAAWVYPTGTRYQNIIANWFQNDYSGWSLRLTNSNQLELLFGNGALSLGTTSVSTATVSLNTWTHVAVTVTSGNVIKLYINGALNKTINSAVALGYGSTKQGMIGANPYNGTPSEYFVGRIDQVGFWPRAFTDVEAYYLYNSYTPISLQADASAGATSSANLSLTARLVGDISANSISQAALTTALRLAGDINSNSIFSDAELITDIKLLGDISSTSSAQNAYLTTTCFIEAQPIEAFASTDGDLDTQISLSGEVLCTSDAVSSQMESIVTTDINDLVYETQLIAYKLAKFVQGFNVNSQNITNLSQGTLASDAINVEQLTQVSGALKNYIDGQDLDLVTNLNSVSGSIIDYVDAADDLLDTAISNLSSSIVNYIDVADSVLSLAMSELSNSLKVYADARNDVLNQNINNASSSLKQYADTQDSVLQTAINNAFSSLVSYINTQDQALSASIVDLSDSASATLTAETQARTQQDTAFVKLDGSRILSGNLDIGGNNITNARSGTLAGDLIVQGNLQVNGDYMRVNKLDVSDEIITIAKGAVNSADANGAGLSVDGANVSFTYDNQTNKWTSNIGLNVNSEAGFDAAIKLSGSTFTNITTVVTNNKYNLSNAIHDLDVAIKDQATRVSDAYDSIRLIVVGQIVDGSANINLTQLGGAQFVPSEISNISLDVLVSEDGASYSDNFVSSKIYITANEVNVFISSPAVAFGYYRLIAINQKKGVLG